MDGLGELKARTRQSQRLKREYKGALAFGGSVLLLFIIAFTLVAQPWNPRVLNQNLLKQCNEPWPPTPLGPNISQREQFLVLLANPGTSPRLCVGYSSQVDSQVALRLRAAVVALNLSTGGITVAAEPYNLTVPNDNNGISPVGVAYAVFTLQIPNGSHGFYVLDLPGDCPRLLAVGYPPSQITQGDFGSWVQRSLSCTGNPQAAPDTTLQLEGGWDLNSTNPYFS